MSQIQTNLKTFFLSLGIAISVLSFNEEPKSNREIYGKWMIENIVFVSPPEANELDEIFNECKYKNVVITKSKFIFEAKKCFLFKSVDNFKITERFILTLKEASANDNYYDKTIFYVFADGKRDSVEAYKTNYTFKSSEGEVPQLELFLIDNDHMIINQDANIVFLKRII